MRTTRLLSGIALLLFGTAASANNEQCTELIADGGGGGGEYAGLVCVSTDGPNLLVRFTTEGFGWCLTQTHLDVQSSPDDFPNKNGNPIPGQFAYGETYDSCVTSSSTFQVANVTLPTFIAAHAVLWDESSGETLEVVSGAGTPITKVNGGAVAQDAVLAKEPFNYPNCASYTESNTNKSVWDNGIGTAFFTLFNAAGADWIWDAPHPLNPRTGDYITFEPTFTVPGLVTGATLAIAADNAFTVDLNGAFVGKSVTLGPDFPSTLRETPQGTSIPQVSPWGVASQGWDKAETFVLPVVMGDNTLTITAANEYMCSSSDLTVCPTGPDRYKGWNSTTKTFTSTIFNDPLPGNGAGVQPCYNPGAVIFAASIDYYARKETGWGAGPAFPGRNWATYFQYPNY